MKKKILALALTAVMLLTLAACGGGPASNSTPPSTEPTPSTEPAPSDPVSTEGTVYTTTINDADVTITLSADQKSATVDAMGMTVEGSCEVKDNILTFKEQTSGNAQIWTSLTSRTYTLNADRTATAADASGSESVYTTTINDADVTITLSADQKSAVVDAMGMTVEGTCEVTDNVLTFKEQTSGNAQIWASLTTRVYTLNADGTATAADASEQSTGSDQGGEATYPENSLVLDFTPDTSEKLQKTFYAEKGTWGVAFGGQGDYTPTDSADELFAWVSDSDTISLTFFADGTYKYEFTTMSIEEAGTWTWAGWSLTVTTAGGNSFTGSISK